MGRRGARVSGATGCRDTSTKSCTLSQARHNTGAGCYATCQPPVGITSRTRLLTQREALCQLET